MFSNYMKQIEYPVNKDEKEPSQLGTIGLWSPSAPQQQTRSLQADSINKAIAIQQHEEQTEANKKPIFKPGFMCGCSE